jgi:hypothetical protein
MTQEDRARYQNRQTAPRATAELEHFSAERSLRHKSRKAAYASFHHDAGSSSASEQPSPFDSPYSGATSTTSFFSPYGLDSGLPYRTDPSHDLPRMPYNHPYDPVRRLKAYRIPHDSPFFPTSFVEPRAQSMASEKLPSKDHAKPPNLSGASDYTMWVGNVPSDTTEQELVRYFSQTPLGEDRKRKGSRHTLSFNPFAGVLSAYVIPHTNCAFVNFESKEALDFAVEKFHRTRLRPGDPTCLKMICKVRTKEDERTAGVNLQRGTGMHVKWVKKRRRQLASRQEGPSERRSDDSGSASDVSEASTTSSLLAAHFPIRYFILKSSSQVKDHRPLYYLGVLNDNLFRTPWMPASKTASGLRSAITKVSWTERFGSARK